jgi:hypothetical protein
MLDNWLKVAIPFVAGLETKAATAVVGPDKLAVLENGVFTKQGNVAKRFGYTAVPDYAVVGTIDGARRGVFDGNGALTLATDRRLYGRRRPGSAWASCGRYAAVTYRAEEVAHANRNQTAADSATANGVTAVVWKYAANSLYFQLFDENNTPLCAVTALATATANYPSALAVGNNILLCYVDTSTNDLKARVIRTSDVAGSIATATTVTVRSDLTADRLYSVCEGPAGTGLVAWEGDNSAGVNGIGVAHVDEFGTTTAVVQVTADATALPPAVAYNATSNTVCVAWAKTAGNVEFREVSYGTLSGGSETSSTVATAGRVAVCATEDDASAAAGKHFCIAIESTVAATDDLDQVTLVTTGTITTTVIRHAHLASRGFALSGQGCFVLGHESRTNLQNAYYLYSHDAYLIGAFEQATALDRSTDPELPGVSGGTLALGFQRSLDVDDFKAQYTHTGIRLLRFDDTGRVSTAKLGQTTYLSGCQLWAYDGNQPIEAGFHMFPDVALGGTCSAGDGGAVGDFTQVAAGSNLADATQYNYRFYYEWYNARGERCRSLPMQRSVTTSIASCEMKIRIPTLRHTLKSATYGREADVSIVVYRTEGNDSNVYFRVSSPDPSATGDNGYVANSFSADYVDFTDDMADAVLDDCERDMFSLSQLLAAPISGPEVLYATADRLYLAGGSIPQGSVLPSKQHDPGEMVECASENEARPCTDRVTALSSINETIVAFTQREVFLLSGPGFDNAGGGQPFGTGRVTTDVGCTDAGSVVVIPGGLLFKSSKGIHGMGQDFSVEYVGAPVEAFNAQTVRAGCVVPDTNQVIFLCDTGVTLMFDYFYGQWGTFTQHLGADACVVGDDYAYLRTDGIVYVRATGTYTDAGAPIIMKIRTGRFRGEELQGQVLLKRFGILGEYKSPHSLKVRLFYDRNEYASSERVIAVNSVIQTGPWGSDATWGAGDFWGGSGGISDYRFVVRPKRTKFSQIAFEFEDVITEEAGASFELTELLLEVKPMDGIQNTSAARKV